MHAVLSKGGAGERLRDGYRIAIIGPPNAGKSSLLNAIARREIAIISSEPGTTRDILELRCDVGGLPITFQDTAGLRLTENAVEREGIRRAEIAARDADIVLRLQPIDSDMKQTAVRFEGEWSVITKIDCLPRAEREGLAISAVTGEGIPFLLQRIADHLKNGHGSEPALVSEGRQLRAIGEAAGHIESVLKRISNDDNQPRSEELLAECLRLACRALDRLIGRIDAESVLDEIFGRFCIGK
jgi:tRNA modification GTPase